MNVRTPRPSRARRAAALLELIAAITIFVAAGLAILASTRRALDTAVRTREAAVATDLAASTLAKLRAGIASPESLIGPADPRALAAGDDAAGAAFDNAPPEETGWEIEIDTEPTAFGGLTLARITARRADPQGRTLAEATAAGLFRLAGPEGAP